MQGQSMGMVCSSSSSNAVCTSSRLATRSNLRECRVRSQTQHTDSFSRHALSSLQRPPPPKPAQQQQQLNQQQQGQHQQPARAPATSMSGLEPGPSLPRRLLAPPSRMLSHPKQQRPVLHFDDSDVRMAAYDVLQVQVTPAAAVGKQHKAAGAGSFNRGPCKVRSFMAAAMKAAGLQRPTPVQGALMAAISAGSDVLSAAPPAAGNSTGALLGVITQVLSVPRSLPRNKAWPLALILCPTRELALQQAAQASQLVTGSHLIVRCVTGGTPLAQQALELRHGADIVVATPGRLLDLLSSKHITLRRLKFLVLEEVDEVMGPALLPTVKQLLHHHSMPHYTHRQSIALGSSAVPQQQLLAAAADALQPSVVCIQAAWPQQQQHAEPQAGEQQQHASQEFTAPPMHHQSVSQAAADVSHTTSYAAFLADPNAAFAATAAASAAAIAPSVRQQFEEVSSQLKPQTLLRLLAAPSAKLGTALVFTNTTAAADEVAHQLEAAGVAVGVLHHAASQTQREESLQCLKYGVTRVLVACGCAFKGLDLADVALVVNYDIPVNLAEYARRLGVTGRQGRSATAITFVTPADGAAGARLAALLKAVGQHVPDWLAALVSSGHGSSHLVHLPDTAISPGSVVCDQSGGPRSDVFRVLKAGVRLGAYQR